ncbi:MAG: hydrogenase expression/formation protein HupK [Rhodobacteraceae bacterium]|jgi:hypothetical protein|uniref:Hydrogenase maturation factor HoxV/HupK n=1 Tax=Salipiger profundus TaxID=1229727 RepID=A0A1U7D4M9_9RHOB|nr:MULTISPECIES: hydrogenase expression/formation protein HupK [Salipiger]APX23025.1 Hydrogenase maturation factor HoxV/HupK [Salipiger profundus]MAB04687.1 hydrogenase expression/formation protein HupK [Paracoccaceae bacterium]GGA12793.1 HupK protein [Salipiger profundus]SFD21038.1 hypothetical protein SAMN05444415_108198 [Salipiger profundus]
MLAVPVRPLPRLVARPVPALPVAALVVGRPVGEVEALLPRLFNLCSGAQKAAFSAALGGHASVAESRADVLRDHLLKFHATWPSLLGIAPQTLPTKWKQGGLSLLSWLFGPSAAPPATPDAFAAFLCHRDNPLAQVLAMIADRFAPGEAVSGLLPEVTPETIWAQGALENSVAARHAGHPVMRSIEARHGRGPLWRASARLYDIEAVSKGRLPAVTRGAGWAMVPATRGTYAMRLSVSGEGRVTAFERVTPTDALLAPGGILDDSLATLPPQKSVLAPLLLDILDPCAPVQLEETEDA